MSFSRDEFLAAAKPKTQVVDVPEWGMSVLVREFTGAQLLQLGADSQQVGYNKIDASAHEITLSVIAIAKLGELKLDELGPVEQLQPILTPEDVPAVLSFGAGGVLRIRSAMNKLNGIGTDHAKNSAASQA